MISQLTSEHPVFVAICKILAGTIALAALHTNPCIGFSHTISFHSPACKCVEPLNSNDYKTRKENTTKARFKHNAPYLVDTSTCIMNMFYSSP